MVGNPYPVKVYTDHQALLGILRSKDAHGRITRWNVAIGEFNMEIKHVPGKKLGLADGLSRIRPEFAYRPLREYGEDIKLPNHITTHVDPQDHELFKEVPRLVNVAALLDIGV